MQLQKKRFNNARSRIRASFVILTDILLFAALATMYHIDQMINGTFYCFGLIFDAGWVQPYFDLSRFFVVVLIKAIIMAYLVELPISVFKEKSN